MLWPRRGYAQREIQWQRCWESRAFQVKATKSEELCSNPDMSTLQLEPVKNMNEEWPMVSTGNVPLGAKGNWLARSGNAPSKLLLWTQISRLKAKNRSDEWILANPAACEHVKSSELTGSGRRAHLSRRPSQRLTELNLCGETFLVFRGILRNWLPVAPVNRKPKV